MMLRFLDRFTIGNFRASNLDLAVLRILTASVVLIVFAPNWVYLADSPDFLFSPPPGTPRLMPTPPPRYLIDLANLMVIVSASALLLGIAPKLSSIATSASMLFLNSLGFTLGKIDHDIMFVLLPMFMAFADWGKCLTVYGRCDSDPRTLKRRPALALFALAIALSMTFAGLAKAGSGWLDWDTQASLGHVSHSHYVNGRPTFLSGIAIEHFPAWLHEVGDWATVVFELSLIPALLSPVLFRTALVVAMFFHFGVLLMLDIPFFSNPFAYAAFAPWGSLVPVRWRLESKRWFQWAIAVSALLLTVFAISGETSIASRLDVPMKHLIVISAFVLAVGFAIANMRRSFQRVYSLAGVADHPVIYFDGVCGICNRWVDFVISRDRDQRFRFATLQSTFAAERLSEVESTPTVALEAVVVATENVQLSRSDAILAIYHELGILRWTIPILAAIPSALRDVGYDVFASIRYRIGRRRSTCRIPSAKERDLFISE